MNLQMTDMQQLDTDTEETAVVAVEQDLQSGEWENESLSQIPFKVLRGHRDGVNSCEFCHDGSKALTASDDGTVKFWDTATTRLIHNYSGHTAPVSIAKVTKDGRRMLSCSWDKLLHFWDLESGKILWTAEHGGIITSCDVSSDGLHVVSASDFDNHITIRSADDGSEIVTIKDLHQGTPTCCAFSPNSERIATTGMDRNTKIWDLLSRQTTASLSGHSNIISCCAFSQNERYLCTTSWDKTLQIWDISTGMYRSQGSNVLEKGHEGCVSSCRFSMNSQILVSGGYDKAVVLWDVANFAKKIVLKGQEGWVTGVDVSPDNKWVLSSSKDKTVRLWSIGECDHIPAVLENRRAMGLKIPQCANCGKPFSIPQLEDCDNIKICVFCRLADPARNTLPSMS